jgi:hypothetical protein
MYDWVHKVAITSNCMGANLEGYIWFGAVKHSQEHTCTTLNSGTYCMGWKCWHTA